MRDFGHNLDQWKNAVIRTEKLINITLSYLDVCLKQSNGYLMFDIKDRSFFFSYWENSLQRKSKYINSLKPALSLGKLCIF